MILLFDIDGTLISAGGAGRGALALAFEAVLGVVNAMDGVRLDGSTDLAILDDAFRLNVGRPPSEAEIQAIFEAYLVQLELLLRDAPYKVFSGADELARAALAAGHIVGLATGNLERGARIKLARGRLDAHFAFGGFGSDAKDRGALVCRGVERGQERFAAKHGRPAEREEIFVIGDTEKDVLAARVANATAVGVLEGSRLKEALLAAGPDVVAETLLDAALWQRFGLA